MLNRTKVSCIILAALLIGCGHPLDIEGQGDIVSMSGERDCAKENAPCENTVVNEYVEAYTAEPHQGHAFIGWEGCGSQFPQCRYDVPAANVKQFWGQTPASLRAIFKPITLVVASPPDGGVGSSSVMCGVGEICRISRAEVEQGFTDLYTAQPAEGYRFDGWAEGLCVGSTYPCQALEEEINLVVNETILRSKHDGGNDLTIAADVHLAPTFALLSPGSLVADAERTISTSLRIYGNPLPEIAALDDGGYIVVWNADDQEWAKSIMMRRYSKEGEALGEPFEIYGTDNYDTYFSHEQVISLDADRILVIWLSTKIKRRDPEDISIMASIVTLDEQLTSSIPSIMPNRTELSRPTAVKTPGGGFRIMWTGSSYDDYRNPHPYAQDFSADGERIGEQIQLGVDGDTHAAMAYFNDGRSVIASSDSNFPYDNRGVSLQCLSAQGEVLGTSVAGDSHQLLDNLAIINDDYIVLSWKAFSQDPDEVTGVARSRGLFARQFDQQCKPMGDQFQIDTDVPSNQNLADIAAMSDSGFVIAWQSASQSEDGSSAIYFQGFNAQAEKVRARAQLSTFIPAGTVSQSGISLASLRGGAIAAAWASSSQVPWEYLYDTGGGYSVYGKLLSVDSDGDLITDQWENKHGLDPLYPYDALLDADLDGAHNLDEFRSNTDPLVDD